jgi:hypothetical protein
VFTYDKSVVKKINHRWTQIFTDAWNDFSIVNPNAIANTIIQSKGKRYYQIFLSVFIRENLWFETILSHLVSTPTSAYDAG